MTFQPEEWRPVPSFPGYEASNQGRVRSLRGVAMGRAKEPRVLKQHRTRKGYWAVCVLGKRGHTKVVHALVLEAFRGPRPDGFVSRHLDDDKDNNALENLVWGTPKENSRDVVTNGNHPLANKTHCLRGHPYDGVNSYVNADGHRVCRGCELVYRERRRARRIARQKGAAA